MRAFKLFLVTLGMLLVASCSNPTLEDYRQSTPEFDFKTFFNGDLMAYGVVQDYSGKVTRKFTVSMKASWQGNQGVIDEDFVYDDGEKQKRIWRVTVFEDGRIEGTADDVIGIAKGQSAGSAFYWRYQLDIPYQDSQLTVTLDDWMFLVDEKRLINRTAIEKWGIEVGQVLLVMEKP